MNDKDKALEYAVLKCLEYRQNYDTLSCSSCFANEVINDYGESLPCKMNFDADEIDMGYYSRCKYCKESWIKAFKILAKNNASEDALL